MADEPQQVRHSKAHEPELITDPVEKAEREARNALRQFDVATQLIDDFLRVPERPFRLRPSQVMQLHAAALEGLSAFAGRYRPAGVDIEGSRHVPPLGGLVPTLVEDMCDYVNGHWKAASAIHLAAFVMWRLNWIHPFDDGNGRTSRMTAHIVLCVRLGYQLPGRYTIPEQIAEDKGPYYRALEAADTANQGFQDPADGAKLQEMEALLEAMLARQLMDLYKAATTNTAQDSESRTPKFH